MLPPQLVLNIPVKSFLGPLPRLNISAENMWAPFHGQNKAKEEYRIKAGCENLNKSKNVSKRNGIIWRGEGTLTIYKIQNIKPTEGAYHHPEGLWDWSIYKWSRVRLVSSTWVE